MKAQRSMHQFIWFIERKMLNPTTEKVEFCGEYSDRNNRAWGYPEYMEEYRLARGYERRNGRLQEKVDPRSLNYQNIPTNDFNLPAVPGMNMLPLNARIATNNRYLDQCKVSGYVIHDFDGSFGTPIKIPLVDSIQRIEDLDHQWIQGNIKDLPGIQDFFRKETTGKLNREIEDGGLVIPQSGNYIIYYMIEFYHGQGRDHINARDKIYGEVSLYERDKPASSIGREAKYTITVPDYISWTIAYKIEAGQKIWLSCRLKAVDNCFVRWRLVAIKLNT